MQLGGRRRRGPTSRQEGHNQACRGRRPPLRPVPERTGSTALSPAEGRRARDPNHSPSRQSSTQDPGRVGRGPVPGLMERRSSNGALPRASRANRTRMRGQALPRFPQWTSPRRSHFRVSSAGLAGPQASRKNQPARRGQVRGQAGQPGLILSAGARDGGSGGPKVVLVQPGIAVHRFLRSRAGNPGGLRQNEEDHGFSLSLPHLL